MLPFLFFALLFCLSTGGCATNPEEPAPPAARRTVSPTSNTNHQVGTDEEDESGAADTEEEDPRGEDLREPNVQRQGSAGTWTVTLMQSENQTEKQAKKRAVQLAVAAEMEAQIDDPARYADSRNRITALLATNGEKFLWRAPRLVKRSNVGKQQYVAKVLVAVHQARVREALEREGILARPAPIRMVLVVEFVTRLDPEVEKQVRQEAPHWLQEQGVAVTTSQQVLGTIRDDGDNDLPGEDDKPLSTSSSLFRKASREFAPFLVTFRVNQKKSGRTAQTRVSAHVRDLNQGYVIASNRDEASTILTTDSDSIRPIRTTFENVAISFIRAIKEGRRRADPRNRRR